MARLLVMAQDQGDWRLGIIVTVKPDEAPAGQIEGLPLFVWVDMPGVSVEALQHWIAPWTEGEGDEREQMGLRAVMLAPALVQAAVASGGRVTRTLAEVQARIIDARGAR